MHWSVTNQSIIIKTSLSSLITSSLASLVIIYHGLKTLIIITLNDDDSYAINLIITFIIIITKILYSS